MSYDINEMRERHAKLQSENEAALASMKTEDGVVVVDAARRDAVKKNLAEMGEIREAIKLAEAQAEAAEWGKAPASESKAVASAAEQAASVPTPRADSAHKTVGQLFAESPEFAAYREAGYQGKSAPFALEGLDLGTKWVSQGLTRKDTYTAVPQGGQEFGLPNAFTGIFDRLQRQLRVRDLMNATAISTNLVEYFRVTGFTNAASVTAERTGDNSNYQIAPQSALTYQYETAPVRMITHFETAHVNTLADQNQLRAIIDNNLLYGLRLHEDYQLLQGDGTGENILGLLNVADIGTYTHGTGANVNPGIGDMTNPDTRIDDIRRAVTQATLANVEPTGVVVHPLDWEIMETTKTPLGDYVISVVVADGAVPRVWQLPVVATPAIPQGTALVGSFGLGATLYDRLQPEIRVADQHGDLFLRHAVAIMATERIALAVPRPEAFVKVNFDGPESS
jgi:HK97 family phage major capsid protein